MPGLGGSSKRYPLNEHQEERRLPTQARSFTIAKLNVWLRLKPPCPFPHSTSVALLTACGTRLTGPPERLVARRAGPERAEELYPGIWIPQSLLPSGSRT